MKIGLIQLCSVLDHELNLKKIRSFLNEARLDGAKAVFLPEVFYSLPDGMEKPKALVKEHNEHYENIRSLALDFNLAILGGSVCYENEKGQVPNRSLNFDASGRELGFYDKIHLFRCNLPQVKVDEGDLFTSGKKLSLIECGELKIGLSICFDLRYPAQFMDYREKGANLLSISSAFTKATGEAGHWETLVRARAIENQCFVVATNQWGKNGPQTQTFGHSMIVDPWGKILVNAGEGEKYMSADIDLSLVELVRKKVLL